MTARGGLYQLVDEISEQEADDALRYIAARRLDPMDPTVAAFRDALPDDEPFNAEDERALSEVAADRAAGVPRISLADVKRRLAHE